MILAPVVTQRLLIRLATTRDIALAERTWTDAVARRFLGGPLDADTVTARRSSFPRPGTYVVELRTDCAALGVCWLTSERGDVELSYVFLPEHWGNGYAREATSTLIAEAFQHDPALDRIVAVTQTANRTSRKLLADLGMTEVDTFVEWGASQSKYAVPRAEVELR